MLASCWLPVIVARVLAPASIGAQEAAAPLSIEALLTAPTLSSSLVPAWAPDGLTLAYTVIDNTRKPAFDSGQLPRRGVPWYALGSDIWLSGTTGEKMRNLTAGRGNNWGPSWSPDGRRIAFLSDRLRGVSTGQTHLWIWERASGRLRQASDLPIMDPWGHLGRLEWLSDNRTVLVKTYPERMTPAAYAMLVMGDSVPKPTTSDTGVTAQVFRFDPAGRDSVPQTDPNSLTRQLGELALVDVETGAIRRVSGSARITSYALSPDRRRLAWAVATGFERPGSPHILMDLMVQDLETVRSRRVATGARLASGYPNFPLFSWSPTSRVIAYRTDGTGMPDDVYVVPLDGGTPRRIVDGPAHDGFLWDERPLWDHRGRHLYLVRSGTLWRVSADGSGAAVVARAPNQKLRLIPHRGDELWSPDRGRSTIVFTMNTTTKRAGLAGIDLSSGRITQLHEEDRAYSLPAKAPAVTPDGRAVVYAAEDPRNPRNLWLAQLGQGRPRELSRIAAEPTTFWGGTARIIEWRGLDGDTLRGALVYPAAADSTTRFPLIVKVYGGTDLSEDLNRFGFASSPIENLQIFVSRGYAVLLADSRLRVGTPMLDLLKSVMPGVDRAIELGVADPARLGIMGHSYGGYSTLSLIVQSRRFKAAVMRAGFGDLIGAYGHLSADGTNYMLSWAERGQGRMGGTPWEVRERYLENSPIFYLDRVETPLLIVHGSAEDNYPFLADQVFTGLRRLGKRVEYARYRGADHWEGLWSRPNQIDYLTRVVAWFDRYLKDPGPPTLNESPR